MSSRFKKSNSLISKEEFTHKTYKQKLLLTSAQESLAIKTLGCCRQIYNAALKQREMAYNLTRKSVSYGQQSKDLTEAKKEILWLNEPPAVSLQQALLELDTSMQRFFQGISGYPQRRKRNKAKSFIFHI